MDISNIAGPGLQSRHQLDIELADGVFCEDLARVEAALDAGANPETDDASSTPLVLAAAQTGNFEILNALLRQGADPRKAGTGGAYALLLAITHESDQTLVRLLAAGCDANAIVDTASEGTALHLAAELMFEEGMKHLLQAGADPNTADREGRTPLHVACAMLDRPGPIKTLLDLGANPFAVDVNGATALHVAAREKNQRIVKLLISRGAPVNQRDRARRAALHYAANSCASAAVFFLLKAGADPSLTDREGNSPLHLAARKNFRGTIVVLLMAGANAQRRIYASQIPLELTVAAPKGYGGRAALSLLEEGPPVPRAILDQLLCHTVQRASDIPCSAALVGTLLQRNVSPAVLTTRDFRITRVWNNRVREIDGISHLPEEACRVLQLLDRAGCLKPASLMSEML